MDRATAIKSIADDLKLGLDRKAIVQKLAANGKKDLATYYRWFSVAEKTHKDIRAKAAPLIEAKEIEALGEIAKERIKKAIIGFDERMEILSNIAKGRITFTKEVVTKQGIATIDVKPDFNDRRGAIAELNKMDGAYNKALLDLERSKNELSNPDKDGEFNGFELEEL